MRQFQISLLAFSSLVAAASARAGSTTEARTLVETDAAVFWEPEDEANSGIIFYFPKTETVVAETGASSPQVTAYTATLKSKMSALPPLESVHAEWSGKTLRPFSIKANEPCQFDEEDALFVQVATDLAGRTVSGAEETFCQFRFSIRTRNHDEVLARIEQKANANNLILRELTISLTESSGAESWTLPWADAHQLLKPRAPDRLEHDEAVLLLGLALAQDKATAARIRSLESGERLRFVEDALEKLFDEDSAGRLVAVRQPPSGQFTSIVSEVRHVSFRF